MADGGGVPSLLVFLSAQAIATSSTPAHGIVSICHHRPLSIVAGC
jgi:hypothetical protein